MITWSLIGWAINAEDQFRLRPELAHALPDAFLGAAWRTWAPPKLGSFWNIRFFYRGFKGLLGVEGYTWDSDYLQFYGFYRLMAAKL